MGIRAVKYGLSKWKGKLCSTCELLNDKSVSYVSAGKLIKSGGIEAIFDYYKILGESFYNDLIDRVRVGLQFSENEIYYAHCLKRW